jgi:hypothetical protein
MLRTTRVSIQWLDSLDTAITFGRISQINARGMCFPYSDYPRKTPQCLLSPVHLDEYVGLSETENISHGVFALRPWEISYPINCAWCFRHQLLPESN